MPWESLALENLTKQRTPKKRVGRVFAATAARTKRLRRTGRNLRWVSKNTNENNEHAKEQEIPLPRAELRHRNSRPYTLIIPKNAAWNGIEIEVL